MLYTLKVSYKGLAHTIQTQSPQTCAPQRRPGRAAGSVHVQRPGRLICCPAPSLSLSVLFRSSLTGQGPPARARATCFAPSTCPDVTLTQRHSRLVKWPSQADMKGTTTVRFGWCTLAAHCQLMGTGRSHLDGCGCERGCTWTRVSCHFFWMYTWDWDFGVLRALWAEFRLSPSL